ncbi:MAG: response regulator [Cyclobacteriaceae bacterium]|nr:response regulator [Cyclobacteriaceae bacterium]
MSKLKKKILLVDDSPVIQTLVKKIFYGIGMEVIGLKTGAKVIDTINNNDIDLVIMDIILPDHDGMDLIRQIRKLKNSAKSQLPVICISGHYKNYKESDFEELNVKESLIKPLDYDQLVSAVKKHIGK